MDNNIKRLKGSEKRDLFKWAHKNKMDDAPFYASDADLCLVMPNPRGVVAYLDYKGKGDSITFAEQILYDEWAKTKPVYIIKGNDPENGPFTIFQYMRGNKLILICELKNWNDFLLWEAELRQNFAKNNMDSNKHNKTDYKK